MRDSYYLAPFIQRMNAHALDLSMTVGILFILILALTGPIQYIIAGIVCYVLVFLYPSLNNGQTIGKKMMKIKPIVHTNEQELSWWHLHLRELFKYLSFYFTFGMTHLISFYMISERSDKRAIHDFIFNTRVINLNPQLLSAKQDAQIEDEYYNHYKRYRNS